MESQPQNPEFRNNPEKFHPWQYFENLKLEQTFLVCGGICHPENKSIIRPLEKST